MTLEEMETCKYLGRVRNMIRNIDRINEQIVYLRYSLLPGAIRYDKDRVNSSPKDGMTDTFDRITELEQERNKWVKLKANAELELLQEFKRLPMGKERSFLLRYYIHNQNMEQISEELQVTYRHCFRIRQNAIRMFAETQTHNLPK